MRVKVPPPFEMSFSGSEGDYTIRFRPTSEWDGEIDLSIEGHPMRWSVEQVDREDDGCIALSGMTTGSEPLWDDVYWFELRLADESNVIRFWGDKVVCREDQAA